MLARRQFLLRSAVGAAAFASAPAFANGWARSDALSRSPFGSEPLLQPLRGWSDGMDRLAEGLRVQGRLPAGLRGTLYRNGPGLHERDGGRYRHLFDGDGLVQAWHLGPEGQRHSARFVQTRKFKAEQAANAFLLPAFGTAVPARLPVRGPDDVNTANTSVTVQAGRLYALWEGGSATELDPQTLKTLGPRTWSPELKGVPFSAHPKREPDGPNAGTLWNFGAFGGKLVLYQIGADGRLVRSQLLDLPSGAMLHDFAVSERFIAFLLPPLTLDIAAYKAGSSMVTAMRWDGSQAMRLVLIDKATLQIRKQIELPPALVFHFGNASDDGRTLKLDYVESDIEEFLSGRFNDALQGQRAVHGARSTPQFLEVDLQSGRVKRQSRPESVEFPQVDPRVVGRNYRYVYYPVQRGIGDRWGFNALQRLDLARGLADVFAFDAQTVVEEHVLVPKPGSLREGEGWLVGTGFDARRQRSFCTVFDAEAISAGPLARIELPYWVPFGFHSHFHAT
jgi:all-trans-8'-apo-beta-carotenal 15,15'-oxygenase